MSNQNKELKQNLVDSRVKTAILFLTCDPPVIPNEENFDFVNKAMDTCSSNEARSILYDNYYDDILEWCEMNEW